jgi:ketosteroid isomerase-like protein
MGIIGLRIIRMNEIRVAIIGIVVVITGTLLLAKPTAKSEIKEAGDRITGHKSEGDMDQRVKEFFLKYEKANSSSDISGIGGLYADTFMFGGPNGVQAVKKEDFLKVVPKMKAHFSSMGFSETQLQTVEAHPLDSKYLLATVVWRMKLRNASASKHVEASATYVLVQEQGDAFSIVFQIDHQDLARVIKGQQTTQQ